MGGKGSKSICGKSKKNTLQKPGKDNIPGPDDPGDILIDLPKDIHGPAPGKDPINNLKQAQGILSYLACSKMHHYVPEDIWELPKMKENLTGMIEDNEDALELYSSILYDVDEKLEARGKCKLSNNIFGSYLGFKRECSICHHVYYKKDSFNLIHLDVPEKKNIYGSLNNYFKPRTIEYMCPKCSKMNKSQELKYFKTLPQCLVLELNRFYYDWDKDYTVNIHDYLEFPKELDLKAHVGPHSNTETKYKLSGIITIDGDATEGREEDLVCPAFASYVMYNCSGKEVWYKIEGNTVTECIMDETLLKEKCYGEVGLCSAYMLFYTRQDS